MTRFDATTADCSVYIYREGILSAVGHDLKLRVSDFTLEIGEDLAIRATFRADSLRVAGAMKGDKLDENALSAKDKQDIEKSIVKDVLEAGKYAAISFRSTSVEKAGERHRVKGRLDLHGAVRDIEVSVEKRAGRSVARVHLQQPDFRITPYRALMGALRVKPEVVVEVSVPYGAG